jgi:hypothetical protein
VITRPGPANSPMVDAFRNWCRAEAKITERRAQEAISAQVPAQ